VLGSGAPTQLIIGFVPVLSAPFHTMSWILLEVLGL
jgi:hypothetical protein